jgi:CubicO group peptidase (beta-lactamase class C family)
VSKSWNRPETWFAAIVAGACLIGVAVLGLFAFMNATATPLHPDLRDVPSVARAEPSPQWTAAVEQARQVARAGLVDQNLPGLSVAVGVDGELAWAEGFGWADLEHRVKVEPETRFRIGTASMALTSAAAGVLLERGQLTLDEEIQVRVPAFPKKPWPVTVRQLMGHTAGVRTDSGDEGPLFSEHCERPAEGVRAFAEQELLFEPGTQFRPSSYGWILVSAAIEAAAGEPFTRFVRKAVFEPLGMGDTVADSATETIAHRATPYFPTFAAEPYYGPDPMREIDYSCYAGASVFVSTPSDLVRFGMGIARGTLLTPGTVQALQASQKLASGEDTGYGLGWDLEQVTLAGTPTVVVGHDGDSLGGRVASLMTFREHGIVVAVVSNTSYADTFAIARGVANAFAEHAEGRAPK